MTGEPGDVNDNAGSRQAEERRGVAVGRFDFVESEPGDILHRFVRLAAQLFETEFAALCFVDADRVRIIAGHGIDARECPRASTVFDETIRQSGIVWIADARQSEPYRQSSLVAEEPGVRFFAGAPLITSDRFAIGVLCVMDRQPRPLADLAARGSLADLASCAMSEMQCWRLNRELEAIAAERTETVRELDLIYEKAPVGLTLLDREFRFLRINQRLAEINGKSVEEHIGRTVREILPDLADTIEPLLRRVMKTGEPLLGQELVGETAKHPGVERVWLESFYPIPNAETRASAVAMVVQEVTDQRRIATMERNNANRLRRVLDGIGALVGLLDLDGKLVQANRIALAAAGLTPNDVLGKPFEETYWWSYAPEVQSRLRNAIARARSGETVRYDVPVRVGDGRFITIDFQLAPLHDDKGLVVNLVPSGVDITERKRAEAALAESETLFRETFDQSAVGMAHVGLDGRWLRVNDRLCEIVGHRREDLLAGRFQDITVADDLDADEEHVRRLTAGEIDSYTLEKRYRRADGSTVWANLTVSLRRTPEGAPHHFISVIEDIDARKAAEARLAVVVNELDHRVKNIISTIQSVINHLAREPRSKADFVDAVSGRIRAMANAHDLLNKSQWEGAALHDLVTEELRPYGLGRGKISGQPVWLTAKAALGMCLMTHELATNAAKYGAFSRNEGRVEVNWLIADGEEGKTFRFNWTERDGPEVAPPARRGFGSEIIEHVAAREMTGSATVDYRPEGVAISLTAPVDAVVAPMPPVRADRDTGSGVQRDWVPPLPPLRVLIVEDSALIAMDLESILEGAGHAVIGPAASVAEALACVDREDFDVAILDVHLDSELVTPVAERLAREGVPFAFLTGVDDAVPSLDGFKDIPSVGKPFDNQAVLYVLSSLLGDAPAG